MKKNFFLIVPFLLLTFSVTVQAQSPADEAEAPAALAAETAAPVPAAPPAPDPAAVALKQGRKLVERGELLEARKLYEKTLKDKELSESGRNSIINAAEEVNYKLLFSASEMPESTTHVVAPGDSLYVIARKYGTTIDLIKKINGLTKDTIFPKQKLKVIKEPFFILVDKSENRMILSLGKVRIKTYRVATGRGNITPVGKFKIVNKLENPVWYKTGAVVPPDSPDNELGTRWLGFDMDSYGIHGTIHPESIGSQATSGCVRMLNEEVEELFMMVPLKTAVTIVD